MRNRRRTTAAGAALAAAALAVSALALPPAGAAASATAAPPAAEAVSLRASTTAPDGSQHVITPQQARRLGRPAGLPASASPADAARAFATQNSRALGLRGDLAHARALATPAGTHVVRFDQTVSGVPVVGGQVVVEVDRAGSPRGALSETLTADVPDLVPSLTAQAAADLAVRSVARGHAMPASGLRASQPVLAVYEPALLGAPGPGAARLVWRTEVSSPQRRTIDQFVLVDAMRPAIALSFSQLDLAVERQVCDAGNVPGAEVPCLPADHEALPSAQQDVQDAYDFAGATAAFYSSVLGRDSIDGAGMPLISTVRYCDPGYACPFANAFWDGTQMVYGAGYASADDVVAHELTHGVTERVNGLFYYFQSGAINESLSDIFGELVDLQDGLGTDTPDVRWLMGEDIPGGAIRSMADPTLYGDPDSMVSTLYASGIDTSKQIVDAGGVHSNSGVGNKFAALLTDGGTFRTITVPAAGAEATARIVYQASLLLTSGADYRAFAAALRQACGSLAGSGAVPADACASVELALQATAMDTPPANAPTPQPQADCANWPGRSVVPIWADSFDDASAPLWYRSTGSVWYYADEPTPYLGWVPRYATSGLGNLWGDDPGTSRYSSAGLPATIAVRAGTFLRFDHAWDFDQDQFGRYDGGVLEYISSAQPGVWKDAGSLFRSNGYTGRITSYTNGGNILAGQYAFTGASNGYRTSYLDLSSLAGQSVSFRFLIGSDTSVGGLGWFVDGVVVGACGAVPSAPAITAATPGVGSVELAFDPGPDNGLATTYLGRCTDVADPLVSVEAAGTAGAVTLTGLSAPTQYSCTVVASNALGSSASPAAGPIVPLDGAAPVVSAPVPPAVSLAAPVFTATATDAVGVTGYLVRRRAANADSSWTAWSTQVVRSGSTLRWVDTYRAGGSVCLEIRARDAAGNVSPAVVRCTAMALDDRNLARGGAWAELAATRALRGTLLRSSQVGASLVYSGSWGANGKGVSLVVLARPGGGTVGVYIGGKRVTAVSTASSTTTWKRVIAVGTWAFAGASVKLRVERAGTAGVTIDGLAIRK